MIDIVKRSSQLMKDISEKASLYIKDVSDSSNQLNEAIELVKASIHKFIEVSQLQYSIMPSHGSKYFNIENLINESLYACSEIIKKRLIRFEVDVNQEIPKKLFGEQVQIRKILSNIICSACDLVAKKDSILISCVCVNKTMSHSVYLKINLTWREKSRPGASSKSKKLIEKRNSSKLKKHNEHLITQLNKSQKLLKTMGSNLVFIPHDDND